MSLRACTAGRKSGCSRPARIFDEQRSEFSVPLPNACLALFGLGPLSTLGAHCGPAPGAGARLARPAGRRSPRFVCPFSPLGGAGNTTAVQKKS